MEIGKYLERVLPAFFLGTSDEEEILYRLKNSPAVTTWQFLMVNVVNSDANEKASFSESYINVEPNDLHKKTLEDSNTLIGFSWTDIFPDPFIKFAKAKGKWEELDEPLTEAMAVLKHFLESYDTAHKPCIAKMYKTCQKLEESTIQAVLAFHFFGPLAENAQFLVDQHHYDGKGCPFCKKLPVDNVKKGNTHFGNPVAWHGRADIMVIHKSKCRNMVSVVQATSDTDEPFCKKRKHHDEDSASFKRIKISQDFNNLVDTFSVRNQFLSQTIVNGFLAYKENKDLKEKFIPCFLTSDAFVTVSLYNPEHDILVCQGDSHIIADTEGELKPLTAFAVWLILNHDLFKHNILNMVSSGHFKPSGFIEKLSKERLKIYKHHLSAFKEPGFLLPPPKILTNCFKSSERLLNFYKKLSREDVLICKK